MEAQVADRERNDTGQRPWSTASSENRQPRYREEDARHKLDGNKLAECVSFSSLVSRLSVTTQTTSLSHKHTHCLSLSVYPLCVSDTAREIDEKKKTTGGEEKQNLERGLTPKEL